MQEQHFSPRLAIISNIICSRVFCNVSKDQASHASSADLLEDIGQASSPFVPQGIFA